MRFLRRLRTAVCIFRGHRLELVTAFAKVQLMFCKFCGHLEVVSTPSGGEAIQPPTKETK